MEIEENFKLSDGSFHLKTKFEYKLSFSNAINGNFGLVLIRKHYPHVPICHANPAGDLTCPFTLTDTIASYEPIQINGHDVYNGATFHVENCLSLVI